MAMLCIAELSPSPQGELCSFFRESPHLFLWPPEEPRRDKTSCVGLNCLSNVLTPSPALHLSKQHPLRHTSMPTKKESTQT